MSILARLSHGFPKAPALRGERVFHERRVQLRWHGRIDDVLHVYATVQGTEVYVVVLLVDDDRLRVACNCPYAEDRYEPCKHIWALVLEAERRDVLTGVAPALEVSFDPRLTAELDDMDPLDGVGDLPRPSLARLPNDPSAAPPTPPPFDERMLSPWRRLLRLDVPGAELLSMPSPSSFAGPEPEREIFYGIEVSAAHCDPPTLLVRNRRRKKDGTWGAVQARGLRLDSLDRDPGRDDWQILSVLHRVHLARTYAYSWSIEQDSLLPGYDLHDEVIDLLLPRLCATGRLHSLDTARPATPPTGPGLGWDDGPAWRPTFAIDATAGGGLRVTGALQRGRETLPLQQIDFLLGRRHLCHANRIAKLDAGGGEPEAWLHRLCAGGPVDIPAADVGEFAIALAQRPGVPVAIPDHLAPRIRPGTARPRLSIATAPGPLSGRRIQLDALLTFDYGGASVAFGDGPNLLRAPGQSDLIRRDDPAEAACARHLVQAGATRSLHADGTFGLAMTQRRFAGLIESLVHDDWYVEIQGDRYRGATGSRLRVDSGIDWFEVRGEVDFDGQPVPWPELLRGVRAGQRWIRLGDGTFGLLPDEWVQRYNRLASLGKAESDHLRFAAPQAALLDALLDESSDVVVDESFARRREQLQRFSGIEVPAVPRGFKGQLRGYQQEALGWMAFLREMGFGGCLADDMGLGKTVQVLALLQSRRLAKRRDRRPSLVVVPRSLVGNWRAEASRFTPRLRVLDWTGPDRQAAQDRIDRHDVVLTTYGTLRRDVQLWRQRPLDYVILDEAQAIKNGSSQTAKAVRLLQADHRLALSGTPVENHLGELWSLFEFLNPGMLGSAAAFQRIRKRLERTKGGAPGPDDQHTLEALARAIRPFVLRRTKQQVAPELPERVEQTLQCALGPRQRRWYDELRDHYAASVGQLERLPEGQQRMHVLEALLRLRQAACHPGLIDPSRADEASAKLDLLVPMLEELTGEGHKALVFSQFTSLLGLLRQRLDAVPLRYAYLDGRTRRREAVVDAFQTDPQLPLFLISLKAGGVGLNLTAADYVFLLDPWWNPAVEAQAIDRTHRIGQTRRVVCYRLVAGDTIEEKIIALQQQKRELADGIIRADRSLVAQLTRDDLRQLFS